MLALRQQLGVGSSPHTVVKLINPFAAPAVHCAGVTHPPYLARLQAYFTMTRRIALRLRGTEGEPFAHSKRRPGLIACPSGDCAVWAAKGAAPLLQLPALAEDRGIAATCYCHGRRPCEPHAPAATLGRSGKILRLSGRSGGHDSARHLLARILALSAA